MKRSFWQRLDLFARHLTPVALTLLLIILTAVPSNIPGLGRVAPLLPLISIYHWMIYRPNLMPAYAVFLLGLFQDGLSGTPFGLNALVFLLVYGVVLVQQVFFIGKSFFVVWIGFAFIVAAAQTISWLLLSAYHVTLITPVPLVLQYALSLGLFPVVAWMLQRWQRAFLRAE